MATPVTRIALLGATLLLGATGCSHQEEARPVGTASYQLDGRPISSRATASLYTGNKGIDVLTITLTTTPQPAGGPETLSLVFQKLKGRPDTDYTRREAQRQRPATVFSAIHHCPHGQRGLFRRLFALAW